MNTEQQITVDDKRFAVYTHLFLSNGENTKHLTITYFSNIFGIKNILFPYKKGTVWNCRVIYELKFIKNKRYEEGAKESKK